MQVLSAFVAQISYSHRTEVVEACNALDICGREVRVVLHFIRQRLSRENSRWQSQKFEYVSR